MSFSMRILLVGVSPFSILLGIVGLTLALLLSPAAYATLAEKQVAAISDTQARALLIEALGQQQKAQQSPATQSTIGQYSEQLQQQAAHFKAEAVDAEPQLTVLLDAILAGGGGMLGFLGWAIMVIGGGYLVERVIGYRLHNLGQRINHESSSGWFNAFCFNGLRTLMEFIRIGIFFIAASSVPILYFPADHPTRMTLLALVGALSLVRTLAMLSRAVLAPYAKGIRPFSMRCEMAIQLHRWALSFIVLYVLVSTVTQLLRDFGYPGALIQGFSAASGFTLNLLVIVLLWFNRHTINDLFRSDTQVNANSLLVIFSQTWPLLVTAWLMMVVTIWVLHTFVGNQVLADRVALSWWVTLAFPLVDRLFAQFLSQLTHMELFQSHSFDKRRLRFQSVLQNGVRLILLFIALIAVAEAWGLPSIALFASASGQRLLSTAVDILTIVLIAYIAWELIYSLIERHLPEPPVQEEGTLDGEGAGAGATRTQTLLPLLRSFLLGTLLVTVILTVLHALGVQIGPLIAGAGVVGIAIGFGSQKLVSDVISGIFFLWDDAFRRGEYIETGELRGTVERISIRSMQLRHHLGAVQTIPYGSIETVTNLSRDWVTMKLEMRLPYETDIEQVRKIVKKIGLSMLEDEELGPNMLLPLKSQGVTRMEESALIVRMKFTAKPGEQWVIRREAYRRVRDALQASGISFAHPEVRIHMPETNLGKERPDSSVQQAVAGRLQVRKKLQNKTPLS